MIQVKFEYSEDRKSLILSVNGHANAGDVGKDIICASASILAYTIGQGVKDMYESAKLKKKPNIKLEKGNATVVCKPKKGDYAEALHLYFVIQKGFNLLAHNYPEFVKLKMFE